MAVYTPLNREQVENFLSAYDCGTLVDFEGIVQGVENTNYRIRTDRDKFILTIFEKRTNENDLPFFFEFMNHLHLNGVDCPFVVGDMSGLKIKKILGKAASLISYLDGKGVERADITIRKCFEMGALLARMHKAAESFPENRDNSMSLPAWKEIFDRVGDRFDEIDAGLQILVADELRRAEETLSLALPSAVVHADVFPDNIFEQNGAIAGVIDFYFSATDFLVYDLAITMNAWCFEDGNAHPEKIRAMFDGYQSLRILSTDERMNFQPVARMAALRILMTRSNDWLLRDPDALVTVKNPIDYKRILDFHHGNAIIS